MAIVLTLGEKIKEIRKAKGLSQDNLAYAAGCSASVISRIESGETGCSDEMLVIIKKYMDIENAPLFEHELVAYRNKLLAWDELITNRFKNESHVMQSELSVILAVPFERDMCLLYSMIEARMLFMDRNFAAVEERLDAAESFLDDASLEVRYLFYRNKSLLYTVAHNHKMKVKYLLLALELSNNDLKPDMMIFTSLGHGYYELGKPARAISYFERAIAGFGNNRTNKELLVTKLELSKCYMFMGELDKAKKLVASALDQTQSISSEDYHYYYVFALTSISRINLASGRAEEGLKFAKQAIENLASIKNSYFYTRISPEVYIAKALCLLETKRILDYKNIVEQGIAMVKERDRQDKYTVIFEALANLTTLRDSSSIDYIENIAIPHLRACGETSANDMALTLCEKLEAHYRKRGADKKANAIAVVSRDIYKDRIRDVDCL